MNTQSAKISIDIYRTISVVFIDHGYEIALIREDNPNRDVTVIASNLSLHDVLSIVLTYNHDIWLFDKEYFAGIDCDKD